MADAPSSRDGRGRGPKTSGNGDLTAALRSALVIMQRSSVLRAQGPHTATGLGGDRWTHNFHTYPAGIHPDSVAILLDLLPPGPILDPFCGGGTVLVEAMARGRPVHGLDISPVAVKVARLRTTLASPELLTRFRSAARSATARARTEPRDPPPRRRQLLGHWYEEHVLRELESLRRSCMKSPEDLRPLMTGCLSSILVKTSFRKSDTNPGRQVHHRPPGTTAVLFHKKARELARRLESFRNQVPEHTPPALIQPGDARTFNTGGTQRFPAMLTSPPYPGVYDYLPMQQLRHLWFDIDPGQPTRQELGSRRAFRADPRNARQHWKKDTLRWLARARGALGPGGRLLVVMGDGRWGRKVVGVADPIIQMASQAGLALVGRASVISHDNPQPGNRQEHALLFKRP